MMKGIKIREVSRTPIDYTKVHKSETQPDMALSITDILDRFVRGLPVDVHQERGTFVDGGGADLEKLSRLDRADQAYEATEYAARADAQKAAIVAYEEDAKQKRKEREEQADKAERAAADAATGIDSLDNTMPDDTSLADSKLGKRGRNK